MKERILQNKAEERKPRTRLTKWLAKIAGKYDGELEPKTEAEFYLNEIAENSGGGGSVPTPTIEDSGKAIVVDNSGEYALDTVGGSVLICTDTNGTLDKTMGEIQTAIQAGVPVFVGDEARMRIAVSVEYVDFFGNAYGGSVTMWDALQYVVSEATEAAALVAYPHSSKM